MVFVAVTLDKLLTDVKMSYTFLCACIVHTSSCVSSWILLPAFGLFSRNPLPAS